MQSIRFDYKGPREMVLPDGGMALACAQDVIEGRSYPWFRGESPAVVVDIGAHVGEFTVMAALVYPEATIHGFEPCPASFELLRQNCKPYKNIVLHQKAVTNSGGSVDLHLSSIGPLANSTIKRDTSSGKVVRVEAASAKEIRDLRPQTIKIDAEGVEYEILHGMRDNESAFNRFNGGDLGVYRIYLEFHTESDRVSIDHLLSKTHALSYCRIGHPAQGEMMYVRRQ